MHALTFLHRHKWKVALFLGAILIGSSVYGRRSLPAISAVVSQNTGAEHVIRAVGVVMADPDIELKFPMPGSVREVSVKPGDHVAEGQTLAVLKSDSLAGLLQSAAAAVKFAEIHRDAVRRGTSAEEIALAEAKVDSKRAELERARQALASLDYAEENGGTPTKESEVDIVSELAKVESAVTRSNMAAQGAIAGFRGVLDRLDVQDSIVKSGSMDYVVLQTKIQTVEQSIGHKHAMLGPASDVPTAEKSMKDAHGDLADSADLLTNGTAFLQALPPTQYFTAMSRESARTAVEAEQQRLRDALYALDASGKDLAAATLRVQTEGMIGRNSSIRAKSSREDALAEIAALTAALKLSEAELALKRAPPASTDLGQANARVEQARGEYARLSAELGDTMLTAPSTGTVVAVNLTAGQFPPDTEPAIVVRREPERSVLVYISDEDLAAIGPAASAFIMFDQYPGTKFALDLAKAGAVSHRIGGIDSYHSLAFVHPHPELTVGMNGTVTIVTTKTNDVVQSTDKGDADQENDESAAAVSTPKTVALEWEVLDTGAVRGSGSLIFSPLIDSPLP